MKNWIVGFVAVCGAVGQVQAQTLPPATATPQMTGGNFVAPPPDRVPVCSRESLQAAVDSYLAAQAAGDAKKMAFAGNARYLENMNVVEPSAGLWNKPLVIDVHNSVFDSRRCKSFTEFVVTQGGHPYIVGTRLYVDEGRITRIDSLVTDPGDWLFNANNFRKVMQAEDWGVLPPEQRTSAQDMINGANAYLDLFADKLVEAPWGVPCERLEGGAYSNTRAEKNSTCKVGIPNGVLYIVNRDYLVDEEKGVVQIFCRFGNSQTGMPDSHMFRYINGRFRYVHTLSVSEGRESPQIGDYWPEGT